MNGINGLPHPEERPPGRVSKDALCFPKFPGYFGQNDCHSDFCDYFAGSWRLRRRIRDDRLGIVGRFIGTARFTPIAAGLAYEEAGRLSFAAHEGEARQRYLWLTEGLAVPELRFADGRLFHRLDLSSGTAEVAHECGADRYRGRYLVRGADRWVQLWTIAGPRKALRLTTLFVRELSHRLYRPGDEP